MTKKVASILGVELAPYKKIIYAPGYAYAY